MNNNVALRRCPYLFAVLALALLTAIPASTQAIDPNDPAPALLIDLTPGAVGSEYMAFYPFDENLVFFAAKDAAHGYEPWITDGTPDGTRMLLDINPGPAGSMTAAGPNGPYAYDIAKMAGNIYFIAFDGMRSGIWRTDGWQYLPVKIADLQYPTWFLPIHDWMYFSKQGSVDHLPYLLTTNGGPDERNIRQIGVMGRGKPMLGRPAGYNGRLYFFTHVSGSLPGTSLVELWSCSFDACDQSPIKSWADVPGPAGWNQTTFALHAANNLLFFTGYSPDDGFEVWCSDGTAGGTDRIEDLTPGSASTNTIAAAGTEYGFFYVSAPDAEDEMTWSLRFTAGFHGSQEIDSWVKNDLFVGPSDREIYYIAYDSVDAPRLNRSDGTPERTVHFQPTSASYKPQPWAAELGGAVFFTAAEEAQGYELFIVDRETGQARPYADINPGLPESMPQDLIKANTRLLFTADDGIHGRELWSLNFFDNVLSFPVVNR